MNEGFSSVRGETSPPDPLSIANYSDREGEPYAVPLKTGGTTASYVGPLSECPGYV